VLVRREGGRLKLRQERFFLDRDPARPSEDATVWDIPLPMIGSSGRVAVQRLEKREGDAEAPAGDWVKLNAGQAGFYLTHYDDAGWQALAKAVEAQAVGSMDRYGLQEDAYSLMRAGYLSVPGYLRLAGAFSREENHYVWAGVVDGIAALTEIFVGDAQVPKLEEWGRKLVKPTLAKAGFDEKSDDPNERLLLRATLLGAAVRFADPEAVQFVNAAVEAARKNPATLPPNLRSVIFSGSGAARRGVGLHGADGAARESGPAGSEGAGAAGAGGLPSGSAAAPVDRVLALGQGAPARTRWRPGARSRSRMKPVGWKLLQEHWPTLDERYGKSGLIGHFIAAGAGGIPSEEHAAQVEKFFKDHPAPYASEKIKQTLEGIRARAKFRDRNRNGRRNSSLRVS
jgi:hypothetical protein